MKLNLRRSISRRKDARTEEEKIKQKQTLDANKIENQEKQKQLTKVKAELVKKEFQDNLKENLEQRLFDLTYKLKHVEKDHEFSTMELKTLLSQKNVVGQSPKYSVAELAILFDYYKQFILEINKYQRYLPTKKNFCGFVGISSSQYDLWRQSDDTERQEIMQIIDDYITDLQLTSAQNGEIKEISTIYRTKAEHGMVEATAPVVIEHKSETNIDNIMKQIEAINKGKSLKTIELKKNTDGIYEE